MKKLEYYYDHGFYMPSGKWQDMNAISDDAVNNLLKDLNDSCDYGYKYSFSQVKDAMWSTLAYQFESILEDIQSICEGSSYFTKRLGEPEIDIKEEQRLEAGDIAYDESRGT